MPLQPIAWLDDGLLCAPRTAADDAAAALARCPFPVTTAALSIPYPDSHAALVAGWYRRSDRHAPAPDGVRELIQVAGDGFGPGGHPTTAMCLAALECLPPADAVDVGCGSGLLAQAWARRHGHRVLAIDVDPAAVAQTRASTVAAGVAQLVTVARQPLEGLSGEDLAGRVVFANVPAAAHHALLRRFTAPPLALVASGLRPAAAPVVVAGYRALGMRRVRASRRGGFDCHVLVDAS